jgi:opacity protein-like surface antigen
MDEIVSFGMRLIRVLIAALLVLTIASPALADATVFIGTTTTPSNRAAKGFSIGAGFLIVAFEFEYANTSDDLDEGAPSLWTGMGNVLLQTPVAIHGLQPYFTTGGGVFHEELATQSETSFGLNTGGGVKISLAGPLRARVDYRVFRLRGDPLHETVHRLCAGLNLKF